MVQKVFFFTCSEEGWEYKSACGCGDVSKASVQRAAVFAMGKVHMPSEPSLKTDFSAALL